jgi:two-component system cell cycle sensor histidine kinase/response regulator CckA
MGPSGEPVVLRMMRKDGRAVWTEHRNVAVYDDSGRMVAIEGIARDISERKSLEARLDQAQKMEAFGLLAASTAHDFNNMLTLIRGHCEIPLAGVQPDDPLRHPFEGIKEASEKAALFAQQMLAFGRGKLAAFALVDVSSIVASMKGLLTRLAGAEIQLIIELDAAAGSVNARPGQIEQIVLNLVVNARDAMPDGGTLTVTTFPAGPFTGLMVSDTGSGINAQKLPHIFEPFFTTKEDGTGLGLATVYDIVKRSGGNISVQSQPGRGASFRILFPRPNQ